MTDDEFFAVVEDLKSGKPVDAEKREEANEKLDTLLCCGGHMCGCMGATYRDQYEYYFEKHDPSGFKKYVENGRVI